MNDYRHLATDQSVTFVKSELNAKSSYRSQVLDRGHKTLDHETREVKKLEEDYRDLLKKKERAKRKLDALKLEN